MPQSFALQKFHGYELAVLVTADFIDGADVGVVERGSSTGLPPEAVKGLRVLGNIVRKEFQSDEAPKVGVLGFVDHTHPAAAELLDDAVVGDGFAYHWAES
jgi:hypothetical protein